MLKLPLSLSIFGRHTAKWVTLFSALTMGAFAVLIQKRNGVKKAPASSSRVRGLPREDECESDATERDSQSKFRPSTKCSVADRVSKDSESRDSDRLDPSSDKFPSPTKRSRPIKDLERETEFLLSRLYLCEGDASAGLLVALSNNFALQPDFDFIKEEAFSNAVRNHCVSSNEETSKKALFACCNFFRSKHVHECKVLLNLFFAKLRFLRYVQDYEQLTIVLNCLSNAALNEKAAKYFLPSLDLIGEIVSHQGRSRIASARLAAWKVLANLVSDPGMVPSLMKMRWQWMVAISCDTECETRRIYFLSSILNYYIHNDQKCQDLAEGDLLAVLISPVMNNQLKTKFSQPAIPPHLEGQASLLRQRLDRVFTMVGGESRLKAAYGSSKRARQELRLFAFDEFRDTYFAAPRLLPDPGKSDAFDKEKITYPHHLFEEWDEQTLRDAAVRAVNWYNRISSRCNFPLCPSLPVALQFVERIEEFDYIGEVSRNWSIFLSDNQQLQDISYFEVGQNNAEIAHDLPASFLGPELQAKKQFGLDEAPAAMERMNVLLDEVALLCPTLYQDIMRFRELSYTSVLCGEMPSPSETSRELGLRLNCMNCAIPTADTVNPHRPFLYDREVSRYDSESENEDDSEAEDIRDSILPNRYYDSIGDIRPSDKDYFASDVSCHGSVDRSRSPSPRPKSLSTKVDRSTLNKVNGLVEGLRPADETEDDSESSDENDEDEEEGMNDG